ncbi:MAG: hypothetical protein HPY60_07680 [Candidatus Methanofastidiosum sp.]|nr:hypothetical protein [Methanofastidiosum sp.]
MPFKAYDIRGIYPDQIYEEFAYSLGRALGKSYNEIAVGIDSRIGSEKIKELKKLFKGKNVEEIDGITISDNNWWVNVRPSNTEPLLRITAEASDEETLDYILKDVKRIIGEE